MSDYTFATVIIADADKAQAQSDLGDGFFVTGLSADGSEPATNWMSSGAFANTEMDFIVNEAAWPHKIYFGQDWQAALDAESLKLVAVSTDGY